MKKLKYLVSFLFLIPIFIVLSPVYFIGWCLDNMEEWTHEEQRKDRIAHDKKRNDAIMAELKEMQEEMENAMTELKYMEKEMENAN